MDEKVSIVHQAGARESYIDASKGFAILLVIYGHLLEVFFRGRPDGMFITSAYHQWWIIYAFHMPLFFVLSGLSNQRLLNKSWREVIQGALSLIVLCYIIHLSGVLVDFGMNPRFPDVNDLMNIIKPMVFAYKFSTIVTWFLVSLAIAQVLFYALFRTGSHTPRYLAALCLAASLVCLLQPDWRNFYLVKTWLPATLFFCFGFYVRPSLPIFAKPLTAISLTAAGVSLSVFYKGCPYAMTSYCVDIATQGSLVQFLLFVMLALITSSGLILTIACFKSKRLYRPFNWLGQNSLSLFLINGYILAFLNPLWKTTPLPFFNLWYWPLLFMGIVGMHLVVLFLVQKGIDDTYEGAKAISKAMFGFVKKNCIRVLPS